MEFLESAEFRIESRDLAATTELISYQYADVWGRDREAMRRLLTGYFLRHRSIHVVKKLDHITIANDKSAQVVLYAGVLGSTAGPAASHPDIPESLGQWRGDLIRLEADLIKEADGLWRLLRLNWRQVDRNDLLP